MSDILLRSSPLGPAFREAADPEVARGVLERHLREGKGIQAVRVVKVWPKPDGVFVLLYEITDDKKMEWATAFLFPPGHSRTLRRPPARASYIPEWNAYAQLFPNDYRMPHLRIAAVASRARDIIASTLDSAGSKWRGFYLQSVKPRSYWPSRKCVLRYKGSIGDNVPAHFYVKVNFEDTATTLLDLHKALRAGGLDDRSGLEVAVPIGHCREFQAALFAPARGRMVFDLLDSPLAELSSAEAGRLLGSIHRSLMDLPLPIHNPAEEMGVLKGWVRAVESVGVRDMSTARSLLSRLETNPAAAGRPYFPGHGDFHDKQLLFDGKTLTVLDLDMACRAHGERDAGNFLAHLELRGLENRGRTDQYSRLAQLFAEAYEKCGGRLFEPALHWYCASAFLRLACRATIQPGEAQHFASLVGLAQREIELV